MNKIYCVSEIFHELVKTLCLKKIPAFQLLQNIQTHNRFFFTEYRMCIEMFSSLNLEKKTIGMKI